jgi:hypothetical protein
MDVGRVMRLQGAAREAANSVAEENAVVGAAGMHQAYQRLRDEVESALASELRSEFNRVCPKNVPAFAINRASAVERAGKFHAARGLLLEMVGWLDGIVRHAQMQAEAAAYAAARVKEERGVGFRREDN